MARPLALVLVAVAAIAACDKPPSQAVSDTASAAEPQAAAPPSWTGSWPAELGPVLVVPADTDNTAIVIYPDVAPDGPQRLTLLAGNGEPSAQSVVVTAADSLECGGAPVVHLSSGSFGSWAVGVAQATGVLRTDSLESLTSRDSARLVANLAALASPLTARMETRFTGLPFRVLGARRFTFGGSGIVAAHLVRKLPQEASPLEEHTFLVAERRAGSDSLVLTFSDRSEGTEETAEHYDLLSAVAGGPTLLLLVARDNVSGTKYQVLSRAANGSWRVQWTRPLSC